MPCDKHWDQTQIFTLPYSASTDFLVMEWIEAIFQGSVSKGDGNLFVIIIFVQQVSVMVSILEQISRPTFLSVNFNKWHEESFFTMPRPFFISKYTKIKRAALLLIGYIEFRFIKWWDVKFVVPMYVPGYIEKLGKERQK